MATALGLWRARRLATYGIEWEKSLPREVWIFSDCRQRRVYASKEEAFHRWDLLSTMHERCDYIYEEKWCLAKHTVLRGHDEIPVASFKDRLHEDMLRDPQALTYWKAELDTKSAEAVGDLPPFSIVSSGMPTPGVVYVIWAEDTSRVKIGRSTSAKIRLETFQTASPYPLRLLREILTNDTVALEAALHRRYAKYRKHGEWFDLPSLVQHELLSESFV